MGLATAATTGITTGGGSMAGLTLLPQGRVGLSRSGIASTDQHIRDF